MTWPNFDLEPYHLVWWLLTPRYLLMMMFLRWKTKMLNWGGFSFYVMTSPIFWFGKYSLRAFKWGTTQYGSVDFKIWPWGKQISTRSETHEGQCRSAEWQTICYFHTKYGVDLITATQKIRVSLTNYSDHIMTLTLDLEMVPSMSWLPLRDNYIDVRHVEWGKFLKSDDYIKR
jgi:hypothetical protein